MDTMLRIIFDMPTSQYRLNTVVSNDNRGKSGGGDHILDIFLSTEKNSALAPGSICQRILLFLNTLSLPYSVRFLMHLYICQSFCFISDGRQILQPYPLRSSHACTGKILAEGVRTSPGAVRGYPVIFLERTEEREMLPKPQVLQAELAKHNATLPSSRELDCNFRVLQPRNEGLARAR